MIHLFLAALLFFIPNAQAQDNSQAPIVVELFTSQSCSSCPPADKVLGKLAKENDNVIALSCHVTYWNHLHWEDTLSQNFCTERQRGYVVSLDSRGPYTPQTVINGRYEMIGSQEGKVRKSIQNIDKPLKNIPLTHDSDSLNIFLPELPKNQYVVTLATYGDKHTQAIPSGENRGQTVEYTNPVTKLIPLDTWDGTKGTMELGSVEFEGEKNLVVLVHERSASGPIIAAGQLSL
ncbi:MAG: DUF1223 domain-containing protein [Pseudomonadota bacterium]